MDNPTTEFLLSAIEKSESRIRNLRNKSAQLPAKVLVASHLSGDADFNEVLCALKAARLKAELKLLKNEKPEVIPDKKILRLALVKKMLIDNNKNAEMVLRILQNKYEESVQRKERLTENLILAEELQECLRKAHQNIALKDSETDQEKQTKYEAELYKEYQEMKKDMDYYIESLQNFVAQNYPLPDRRTVTKYNQQKESYAQVQPGDILSLAQLIQKLVNQFLKNKKNPYITIDNTMWPPYLELLLHSFIISRHPENPLLICLEDFTEQ